MEGLGYWVFLLILYGLSALLKKRRQPATQRRPETEKKHAPPPGFTSKEDILKELFGGSLMKEPEPAPARHQEAEYMDHELPYDEEPEDDASESAKDYGRFGSSFSKAPKYKTDFDETTHFDPMPMAQATVDTATIPGTEEDVAGNVTHTTARKQANPMLVAMLKNKNSLKYSFMLREVLDKPRAMRRHIR